MRTEESAITFKEAFLKVQGRNCPSQKKKKNQQIKRLHLIWPALFITAEGAGPWACLRWDKQYPCLSHTYTQPRTNTPIHIHMKTHICTHIHICSHTHISTHIHMHSHRHPLTSIHTLTHTPTYTLTHMHTRKHTHPHAQPHLLTHLLTHTSTHCPCPIASSQRSRLRCCPSASYSFPSQQTWLSFDRNHLLLKGQCHPGTVWKISTHLLCHRPLYWQDGISLFLWRNMAQNFYK